MLIQNWLQMMNWKLTKNIKRILFTPALINNTSENLCVIIRLRVKPICIQTSVCLINELNVLAPFRLIQRKWYLNKCLFKMPVTSLCRTEHIFCIITLTNLNINRLCYRKAISLISLCLITNGHYATLIGS